MSMGKHQRIHWQPAILIALAALPVVVHSRAPESTTLIGVLQRGARLVSFESDTGKGIEVLDAGTASSRQTRPVQLEFFDGSKEITNRSAGYDAISIKGGKAEGIAHLTGPGKSSFAFRDQWSIQGDVVELSRTVTVSGSERGSFLSPSRFPTLPHTRDPPWIISLRV